LLDAIYQLGIAVHNEDISSLLTPVSASHGICILFENIGGRGQVRYSKCELVKLNKEEQHLYLYKEDKSHKALGLFLTGEIKRKDISKISNILKKNPENINSNLVREFIRKKILSFPHGKLIENQSLSSVLKPDRKDELNGILNEFRSKGQTIAQDVIQILTADKPETTLLTVKIRRVDDEDTGPKFMGEMEDYVQFFKSGVFRKKYAEKEQLICSVCNKETLLGTFNESPFPFYFTKKPIFFPDAISSNSTKGFPLCDVCYDKIQNGIYFIRRHMNYSIPSVESAKSELNFWLIPHLHNQDLIINLTNNFKSNNNLYLLNSLKDLCSKLTAVSRHDLRQMENVESFLSFSALFYVIDGGRMHVLSYIQGIYPSQLERLIALKEEVDNCYPYALLGKKLTDDKIGFFIGFPLLAQFFKKKDSDKGKKREEKRNTVLQNQLVAILDKMFTGQQVPLEVLIKNINKKIRSISLKSFDLRTFSITSFRGLMLLEYLISLNKINRDKTLPQSTNITAKSRANDIEYIKKFIESHNNILSDGTTRAVFAIGVCVGILLEIQNRRFRTKTAPFWSRLQRLDLDLERMKKLPWEIRRKLAIYNERKYEYIISYLETSGRTVDRIINRIRSGVW
jgi:CRISPR-associated protein Cas8b/Csh1 subtype I-B